MLELGKASYTQAVIDKRKTVQKKDIGQLWFVVGNKYSRLRSETQWIV